MDKKNTVIVLAAQILNLSPQETHNLFLLAGEMRCARPRHKTYAEARRAWEDVLSSNATEDQLLCEEMVALSKNLPQATRTFWSSPKGSAAQALSVRQVCIFLWKQCGFSPPLPEIE